jgi:hypothetical protein
VFELRGEFWVGFAGTETQYLSADRWALCAAADPRACASCTTFSNSILRSPLWLAKTKSATRSW